MPVVDIHHAADLVNTDSNGIAGQTIHNYLNDLADGTAAPGGGSAAALAGALAAALCAMAAKLTLKRLSDPELCRRMNDAVMDADTLVDILMSLADQDVHAYTRVMAAYRLPADSEDNRRIRSEAVQSALHTATTVPMELLYALSEAVHPLRIVLDHGNIHCRDDVGVALRLLRCAAQSASANIRANLKQLSDPRIVSEIQNTYVGISDEVTKSMADLNRRYFEEDAP